MIFLLVGFLVIILLLAAFCRNNPIHRPITEPRPSTAPPPQTDIKQSATIDSPEKVQPSADDDYDTPISSLVCLRARWILLRPFIAILALIPSLDTFLQASYPPHMRRPCSPAK